VPEWLTGPASPVHDGSVRRAVLLACIFAFLALWLPGRHAHEPATISPEATRTDSPAPSATLAPQGIGVSAGSSHVRASQEALAPLFSSVDPDRSSSASLAACRALFRGSSPPRSFPLLI
jgi:hypothetical protein